MGCRGVGGDGWRLLPGICKIYEEFLKKQNPSMASITYDVSHLYAFIDKLSDLSCLILNTETCQYVPHNKDWIKEKIFVMLRTQAKNE
ncbi:enhancer of rudimentary [Teladorsagia circumcincta]|uniref:Enhancer of rudimentary n=1 Tax=Teladorsagia circumcincta TaxID=45464 RepID=A0A2G9V5F3_TELCI|nr:enhancer of rudimentary [Teladorsagia circumcincta]